MALLAVAPLAGDHLVVQGVWAITERWDDVVYCITVVTTVEAPSCVIPNPQQIYVTDRVTTTPRVEVAVEALGPSPLVTTGADALDNLVEQHPEHLLTPGLAGRTSGLDVPIQET